MLINLITLCMGLYDNRREFVENKDFFIIPNATTVLTSEDWDYREQFLFFTSCINGAFFKFYRELASFKN